MKLDTIAQNIRHYRKMQELTQEDLAGLATLSVTIIRKLEGEKYKGEPRLKTLELIAAALHVSVLDLTEERLISEASLKLDSESEWMLTLSAERVRLLHCFNVALDEAIRRRFDRS